MVRRGYVGLGVVDQVAAAKPDVGTVAGEAQDNRCNTEPHSSKRRFLSATG
jgi:hypothetical protein